MVIKIMMGYGLLIDDFKGILFLFKGFIYDVFFLFGEFMNDGNCVLDCVDGMGCIVLDDEYVVLV